MSPLTMGKITRKKRKNCFRATMITTSDVIKCRRNENFEDMDTERSIGKNDEFWFL